MILRDFVRSATRADIPFRCWSINGLKFEKVFQEWETSTFASPVGTPTARLLLEEQNIKQDKFCPFASLCVPPSKYDYHLPDSEIFKPVFISSG